MEYTITNEAGALNVAMSGQFTFHHNQKFRDILELLNEKELQAIALNLKQVEFIDSAGLGMLLLLRDRCLEKNIILSLMEAQGQVRNIFLVSKFDQLFPSLTEH